MIWLLAILVRAVFEIVLFYELFLYGVRRYELRNAGEPLRYGFGSAVLWFIVEWLTRSAFVLATPLGASFFWPYAKAPFGAAPRPVLLVHGYGTNRASFAFLAWRLRRAGFGPIHAVGYRTFFGKLSEAVATVTAAIENAARENGGGAIDVVGHSLGGLLARRALRDPALAGRVRRLVTLGTPHAGTKVAALAIDPLAQELHPGSDFIHLLSEGDPVPPGVEATSIFSPFDALVLPPRSAVLRGAAAVEVAGVGHNALLISAKVATLVHEALSPLPPGERSARSAG